MNGKNGIKGMIQVTTWKDRTQVVLIHTKNHITDTIKNAKHRGFGSVEYVPLPFYVNDTKISIQWKDYCSKNHDLRGSVT